MNKTVEHRVQYNISQSADCAPVDGLIAWFSLAVNETGSEVAREYCGIAGISININKET
jgi:hypothetical protein